MLSMRVPRPAGLFASVLIGLAAQMAVFGILFDCGHLLLQGAIY
jgi:hypothetical protein